MSAENFESEDWRNGRVDTVRKNQDALIAESNESRRSARFDRSGRVGLTRVHGAADRRILLAGKRGAKHGVFEVHARKKGSVDLRDGSGSMATASKIRGHQLSLSTSCL